VGIFSFLLVCFVFCLVSVLVVDLVMHQVKTQTTGCLSVYFFPYRALLNIGPVRQVTAGK
jgi:hypothetical protein